MPSIPGDLAAAKNALSAVLLAPQTKSPRVIRMLHEYRETSLLRESFHTLSEQPGPLFPLPPLVHAVGVGRKLVEGRRTQTMAVRVYVTRKSAVAALAFTERVPRQVNGIPTDIIEAPPAMFLAAPPGSAARQSRVRPLLGGISTSHAAGETGTLGYFCRSTDPADSAADVFALSNAHVYANYNAAQPGDDLTQPGAADSGTSADRIASFHRQVPLVYGGARNDVDAAIGKLDGAAPWQLQICGIGKVNGTAAAHEDDVVSKHGRTTAYTEGTVDDELIDFVMAPRHTTSYIQFRDQMRIIPRTPYTQFALEGDSGSLVVKTDGHEAVGLLHAAALDGSYAYANHVDTVVKLLHVSLM